MFRLISVREEGGDTKRRVKIDPILQIVLEEMHGSVVTEVSRLMLTGHSELPRRSFAVTVAADQRSIRLTVESGPTWEWKVDET